MIGNGHARWAAAIVAVCVTTVGCTADTPAPATPTPQATAEHEPVVAPAKPSPTVKVEPASPVALRDELHTAPGTTLTGKVESVPGGGWTAVLTIEDGDSAGAVMDDLTAQVVALGGQVLNTTSEYTEAVIHRDGIRILLDLRFGPADSSGQPDSLTVIALHHPTPATGPAEVTP